MQTWAKRGLQTALVTGGLLMLGTGIASAQEDVNPDKPASPLDGSLSIPLQIKDNAIGTPLGQIDLPDVERTISTDEVTDRLPTPAAGAAKKMTGELSKVAAPVTGTISGVTAPHANKPNVEGVDEFARGNSLHNHAAVPIQIAGNALALGGDVEVETDAKQKFDRSAPVNTTANGESLGGNVAGITGALPIQLANNAVGIGADAESRGQATQEAKIGGPINTDGKDASLAGNVLKGQLASPIQVTGNALAGGGEANVESKAKSTAIADGAIKTSGKEGQGSGNIGALPVAYPLGLNGNALSGIGQANTGAQTSAKAQAGATNKDSLGNPFYTLTNGSGQLSGNIAQPELAGPAMINGVAGTIGGSSTAAGETDNHVRAGGGAGTNGRDGQLSGNIANSPVAYPLQVFGDAGSILGSATSAHENTVDSKAGNSNIAYGDDSTLSGNDVVPTLAGSGDIFGSGLSLLGDADGTAKNKTKANSGGYVGTTGNDSQGSGNIVHPPLALPVQVFGLGGSAGGSASGTATNDKVIGSGGDSNSNDDNGVVSSNVVQTPGSIPVELFGSAASFIANSSGTADSKLKSNAGGDAIGTGIGGVAAGNVAHTPLSAPLQAFGDAVGFIGNSDALGKNVTASNAGGDVTSDGSDGTLAGNALSLPAGGAGQLFGNTVGVLSNLTGVGDNDTTSTAGGNVNTTGEQGSLSGNVLSGQLLPVLQAFGNAAGLGGNGSAAASNNTAAGAGGDVTTSGEGGSLSGNLLDVPVALVGQLFGDAIAVGANQDAAAENDLIGAVGGDASTAGEGNTGSGFLGQYPIGIVGQLYNVPVELLGRALTSASNETAISVANEPPEFELISDGGGLPIDQLPSLPGLPGGGGLPEFPGLPGLPGGGGLPEFPGLPELPGLPGGGGLPQLPGLPGGGGLPEFPGLPGLPVQSGGDSNANLLQSGAVSARQMSAPVKPISAPANPISGVLPAFGDLVKLPGLGGGNLPKLPGVGGAELPKLPGLGNGGLPKLPGLGGGNLPKLPDLGGDLPIQGLPVGGDLPGLPSIPGLPELPEFPGLGGNLPEFPGLPIGDEDGPIPGLPGLPELPQIPGLGGDLPEFPGLPGGGDLPELPSLPGLPGDGGLPGLPEVPGVPNLPGLPGAGDLPELPSLPEIPGVPSLPKLPGLPGVGGKQDANLPALSVLDSGDLTGALSSLSKVAGKHV